MAYYLVLFHDQAACAFMLETYLPVFMVAHWTDAGLDFFTACALSLRDKESTVYNHPQRNSA
jgi:hypothetical protein